MKWTIQNMTSKNDQILFIQHDLGNHFVSEVCDRDVWMGFYPFLLVRGKTAIFWFVCIIKK